MKNISLKRKVLYIVLSLLIVIQFFGTQKNISSAVAENAIEKHYTVPNKIQSILKSSCYDCHSNNTKYPWYNKLQPINWWLAKHVNDGKRHLNFDEFNTLPIGKKLHKLDEVVETIKNGEMPLTSYTLIHQDAKLSDADKQEIEAWVVAVKKEVEGK
ncbi:cytochrome C [Sphingobacterium sp. DK4209]|uniref:Cytochrome C n=1 Tax=Sphingobacterium zhuxiongii TaxID=2662364 RepID=A0A5Q0QFS6_9SPHI|nr:MULTISPECIES: heme-binding domain-containing protein [unclassified Sphingobacterium]MVZ65335.1 cytochrome C [Sphingobacterium sp. DK4209]QGA26422.1 cytochrome C [Sphingobacterium sp. dk4302]